MADYTSFLAGLGGGFIVIIAFMYFIEICICIVILVYIYPSQHCKLERHKSNAGQLRWANILVLRWTNVILHPRMTSV